MSYDDFPTWKPNSCDCVINLNTMDFIERCSIHQTVNYNQLLKHNKKFGSPSFWSRLKAKLHIG